MTKLLVDKLKKELESAKVNGEAHAEAGSKWAEAVLSERLTYDEAGELLDIQYRKFHIMGSKKEGK